MLHRMTTALIVIDVQNGFNDAHWGPRNNAGAEQNIALLAGAWQGARDPIVLVRHDSVEPRSPLRPGQSGNDLQPILDGIHPALLFGKHVNSAFHGEVDLHAWLQGRGIRHIVLCGIQTNMCVETTARVGGNLGYDVTFAIDATYTFDAKGPDGSVLSADQLSAATAANLHDGGFATVSSTAVVLAGRA
jgi:nicotinamidase-related amidase